MIGERLVSVVLVSRMVLILVREISLMFKGGHGGDALDRGEVGIARLTTS